MKAAAEEKVLTELMNCAGVTINGTQPWDIQVYNPDFYKRVIKDGALGLGETYMDKWWDCAALDQFFTHILQAGIEEKIKTNWLLALKLVSYKYFNLQTKSRAFEVGEKHYDLGNELFEYMLDPEMVYTCAYWKDADNLAQAQLDKLKLTCQKLMLKPGMTLLDIGCGWGALAKYAAQNYGVKVVGVTISKEQYEFAKQSCAGLPVEIYLKDYRYVQQKFDRIVSLGMFEHVGHLNYRHYMEVVHRCLHDDGVFLLHTIGDNVSNVSVNEWTKKYIFPNGMLPSVAQIGVAAEKLLVMEDWHNFGADYDRTLMAWNKNFNDHWPKLQTTYDERFHRLWSYYLLSCAGGFRARYIQLWQIVFSKNGIPGGYHAHYRA